VCNGGIIEGYEYDPYRDVRIFKGCNSAQGHEDMTVTGDSLVRGATDPPLSYGNPILFAGYFYDNETGLYHVRHRIYSPTLQRWLQRDPAGYVDGANLYEYVLSNPVSRFDPEGLRWRYVPGVGSLSGSLGPGSKGPATSEFRLFFDPDKRAFKEGRKTCCAEVRFIQIYYFAPTFSSPIYEVSYRIGQLYDSELAVLRKWTVDADEPPFYPYGVWYDPAWGRPSWMVDTPGPQDKLWQFSSYYMHFETCAVCSKPLASVNGVEVHDVYACVQWGQSFEIAL